ncbi:hypothetical protein [Metabacillus arenae]|uniref:YodN n=1 Tax=Metabacillus arenae TaxID=2771434 RepID=A0A926ND60_9BACI|nr:hypothetical protein [Metabacillus arenae]MBD1379046.1 hypothetical protein [Metabacillus arenae]
MDKKIPKYRVGDVVVIMLYGTVGTVTKFHKLDDFYLYEVNHGDVLYYENSLELFDEYEGELIETERLEIDYRFFIGDLVEVTGYEGDLFKVVGFRTEIWRYEDDSWEDVIYELTRISDGEWLEADEEELQIVLHQGDIEKFMHHILMLFYFTHGQSHLDQWLQKELPSLKDQIKAVPAPQTKSDMIDELLDIYNDYHILYDMFQDEEYKDMMNLILQNLERYS